MIAQRDVIVKMAESTYFRFLLFHHFVSVIAQNCRMVKMAESSDFRFLLFHHVAFPGISP